MLNTICTAEWCLSITLLSILQESIAYSIILSCPTKIRAISFCQEKPSYCFVYWILYSLLLPTFYSCIYTHLGALSSPMCFSNCSAFYSKGSLAPYSVTSPYTRFISAYQCTASANLFHPKSSQQSPKNQPLAFQDPQKATLSQPLDTV